MIRGLALYAVIIRMAAEACTKTGDGWDESCPNGQWVISNSNIGSEYEILKGQTVKTPAECLAAAQSEGCNIANLKRDQTECWCQFGSSVTCQANSEKNACVFSATSSISYFTPEFTPVIGAQSVYGSY